MNEEIFRSSRLIYRAVEPSDDELLFRDLIYDRVAYQNSNFSNNRLAGKTDASDYRKYCAEKCLIGAVVCLSLPTTTTPSPGQKDTNNPSQLIPIGEIHLKSFGQDRQHHRNSEVGLQLLPAYQGKGYGTEAIKWALKYAFHHTGLHRVGISAFSWNEGAIRLYQKCGFVVEGRDREAAWHDGRWWDIVRMGILAREWRDMQAGEVPIPA